MTAIFPFPHLARRLLLANSQMPVVDGNMPPLCRRDVTKSPLSVLLWGPGEGLSVAHSIGIPHQLSLFVVLLSRGGYSIGANRKAGRHRNINGEHGCVRLRCAHERSSTPEEHRQDKNVFGVSWESLRCDPGVVSSPSTNLVGTSRARISWNAVRFPFEL